MRRLLSHRHGRLVALLVLSVVIALVGATVVSAAPFTQDIDSEIAVMPGTLERLSWGAVVAGAIIALMIQLGLNLLGVGVGVTSLTPDHDDGDNDGSPIKNVARTAVVWIGFSTLVSLFAGGWIAARFAGIPTDVDGMLHGLMVWGVVTIVTLLLLSTTIGRVLSGVSTLISQGVTLAGRVTGVAARGAVDVAQAAAAGVGNVASGVAHTAGNVVRDAQYTAEKTARDPRVRNAVEDVKDEVGDRVNMELDRHPELRQALEQQKLSRESIEQEARAMLTQAGIEPQRVEGEARAAVNEVRDAAEQAAQQVTHDPRQAVDTMLTALSRVLDRGAGVVNEVDRQSVLDVLKARTGMDQQKAEETLRQWEDRFMQVRGETDRVRSQAESQIRNLQRQAQDKVNEVRHDVEHRVDEVKHEVEHRAREAAEATTKAISQVALAAFAAIAIGAVSAGLGGWIGTPEQLPTAEVSFEVDNDVNEANNINATPLDASTVAPTLTPAAGG